MFSSKLKLLLSIIVLVSVTVAAIAVLYKLMLNSELSTIIISPTIRLKSLSLSRCFWPTPITPWFLSDGCPLLKITLFAILSTKFWSLAPTHIPSFPLVTNMFVVSPWVNATDCGGWSAKDTIFASCKLFKKLTIDWLSLNVWIVIPYVFSLNPSGICINSVSWGTFIFIPSNVFCFISTSLLITVAPTQVAVMNMAAIERIIATFLFILSPFFYLT